MVAFGRADHFPARAWAEGTSREVRRDLRHAKIRRTPSPSDGEGCFGHSGLAVGRPRTSMVTEWTTATLNGSTANETAKPFSRCTGTGRPWSGSLPGGSGRPSLTTRRTAIRLSYPHQSSDTSGNLLLIAREGLQRHEVTRDPAGTAKWQSASFSPTARRSRPAAPHRGRSTATGD